MAECFAGRCPVPEGLEGCYGLERAIGDNEVEDFHSVIFLSVDEKS